MFDILVVFYDVFDNPSRSRWLNRIYKTVFFLIVLLFVFLLVRKYA